MKLIGGLMIVAIFFFVSMIIYLLVSFNQLASERSYCRNTPLNEMQTNDYRYCLQYLGDQR